MVKSLQIIITCLVCLFLIVQIGNNVVYENINISEPPGYYLAIPGLPIKKDSYVITCITNKGYKHVFNELGMKDVKGQCDTGMQYLVKRVAAVEGDRVDVTSSGILINGTLYLNSRQFLEGRGVKLYPLPIGYSHVMAKDEFFLLGQSPHSVDSRYFGVVKREDIYRRAFLVFRTNIKGDK